MPVRHGSIAKRLRQERALARFSKFGRDDFYPRTNRPRFKTDDQFADYFARKITEISALQVATRPRPKASEKREEK